ncbi:serine/threonine protein kinase [Roseiconus lacunae]|uniref:serine/threonine protein kinase n=1 Tax=Roseiconus lacunae TaxID=2605694 RepID=UPI001E289564|nr:serine/threonine-protein kinase [Roseiconus lacunae]MCD0460961.1 serine/threonine protein kinase [Roseiconus lacunae]
MPSDRLTDYELGDILGVGTVGTIYLATEKETGRQVALKKLHPKVSQNTLIRARFKREMTIMERLRHPNVVAYLGGGRDDGDQSLFYAMEVVSGGTVADLLESGGPLHWTAVVEISRQICSALQCLHNHGVVHRDLKPSNLFLTPGGEVKLGDFGIARDLTAGDLTVGQVTVGTHAYMAPEQITGDRSVSGKADLYALGCCMFEMLTCRKVFLGENYAQLFDQHLKQKPPSVRDFAECPFEVDQVILKLLEKKPDDRPFNARQVQAVMLEVADGYREGHGEALQPAEEHVFPAGRTELVERIRRRLEPQTREISGTRLAIAVSVIAIAIVALVALSAATGQ